MLSRAAQRRRSTLRQLHRSYDRLHLPWLCPALQRFKSQSNFSFSKISALREQTPVTSSVPARGLATATSDQYDPHGAYIPFEGSTNYSPEGSASSLWNSSFPLSKSSSSSEIDSSSLIVLKDVLGTRPRALRRYKSIGGDANEMLANLEVSLSVGMFDRAGLLIRRLAIAVGHDSEELLEMHNKYLAALVSNMIMNRRPDLVSSAHKWVEMEMKSAGVEPDAATYALMLKMALRMLHSSKRERTVHRYWNLAKDAGIEEDVLGLPILSESDLGLLSEVGCTLTSIAWCMKTDIAARYARRIFRALLLEILGLGQKVPMAQMRVVLPVML